VQSRASGAQTSATLWGSPGAARMVVFRERRHLSCALGDRPPDHLPRSVMRALVLARNPSRGDDEFVPKLT
jgi:hypothetical protein